MANVICKSINQPMVMLEACRVLLCLLALTTRPQAERAAAVEALHAAAAKAAEESGAVPDENGIVPGAEPDAEELANAAYGGFAARIEELVRMCYRQTFANSAYKNVLVQRCGFMEGIAYLSKTLLRFSQAAGTTWVWTRS